MNETKEIRTTHSHIQEVEVESVAKKTVFIRVHYMWENDQITYKNIHFQRKWGNFKVFEESSIMLVLDWVLLLVLVFVFALSVSELAMIATNHLLQCIYFGWVPLYKIIGWNNKCESELFLKYFSWMPQSNNGNRR